MSGLYITEPAVGSNAIVGAFDTSEGKGHVVLKPNLLADIGYPVQP